MAPDARGLQTWTRSDRKTRHHRSQVVFTMSRQICLVRLLASPSRLRNLAENVGEQLPVDASQFSSLALSPSRPYACLGIVAAETLYYALDPIAARLPLNDSEHGCCDRLDHFL